MDGSVGYLFAIVFIVVALNFYLLVMRMGRREKRRKKMNRIAVDEAKQALWRDREIERRLEREQDGALERVKLRDETLALYEKVRQRHAEKDRLEGLGFSSSGDGELNSYIKNTELEGDGLDSLRLENPELNSYLSEEKQSDSGFYSLNAGSESGDTISDSEPDGAGSEPKVEMIKLDSYYTDDNDLDPFDIFKKKKK